MLRYTHPVNQSLSSRETQQANQAAIMISSNRAFTIDCYTDAGNDSKASQAVETWKKITCSRSTLMGKLLTITIGRENNHCLMRKNPIKLLEIVNELEQTSN